MSKSFAVPMLAVIACATPLLVTTRAAAQEDAAAAPAPAEESAPAPAATPATSERDEANDANDAKAKEAKEEDRGLEWVWLNADIGFSYTDLKSAQLAISPTGGAPITVIDTTNTGAVYGFGAGIRLLFLTLGLRARNHSAMNLWQIDGEVGFHGRVGRVEPFLALRFGYDTVGTLGQSLQVAGSSVTPPDVSVHGWNGGLAIGFDYYFSHFVSLGLEGAGDVVYLQRPSASPPALTAAQQAAINADTSGQLKANYQKLEDAYKASASSVGFGAGLIARFGVHF